MKLFVPGETAVRRTLAVAEARRTAVGILEARPEGWAPRETSGIVVRFRVLHSLEVPPEGLVARPPLPSDPTLVELLAIWATALEGVLWADGGQIAVLHVGREWARTTGVEVSL